KFQSYSRQDPDVTTRAPPESRKCVTRSRLARTQSKFSGACAHFPGAMYHARCSKWLAPAAETTRVTSLESKRLARCHVTPAISGGAVFDQTACTVQPALT